MELLPVAILVGVPLAWLVAFAAYVYRDAQRHGMNHRKWAAIAFFVPFFGFFAYLFERGELDYDPSEDPYARREDVEAGFAVHESRRGEKPTGPAGTTADDAGGGVESDDDEWDDPSGVTVRERDGEDRRKRR